MLSIIIAAGALLCVVGFAAAQGALVSRAYVNVEPGGLNRLTIQANRVARSDSRTTLTGVVVEVNGVRVNADRAVMKGGEIELEGNVRMTLPPQ